ncbi:unnamed protein product, partial [Ectocarpus sp. 12 AP-2014]
LLRPWQDCAKLAGAPVLHGRQARRGAHAVPSRGKKGQVVHPKRQGLHRQVRSRSYPAHRRWSERSQVCAGWRGSYLGRQHWQ